MITMEENIRLLQEGALLIRRWYKENWTYFSWRSRPGMHADPYAVWVSEIMLQQTTVSVVERYYQAFMRSFPDIHVLAGSNVKAVLSLWSGLGYYRRAHNLHKCAGEVVRVHGGVFPDEEGALKSLPGIGAYTAGAIRAIAFQKPSVALDTNVTRVLGRFLGITLHERPKMLTELLALVRWEEPGDIYQGIMDIGRQFCGKKAWACEVCPLASLCQSRGNTLLLESRVLTHKKKTIKTACFFVYRKKNYYYFCQGVPEGKMLSGLWIFPSTPWVTAQEFALMREKWSCDLYTQTQEPVIKHVFSHFTLEAYLAEMPGDAECFADGVWLTGKEEEYPLSTLARKVLLAHQRREEER